MVARAAKVLLVSVPSVSFPEEKTPLLRSHEGQPLWMVYLADGLMRVGFPVDTVSADLHPLDEILRQISVSDADLIGITAPTDCYPNVLRAMKLAKSLEKKVIIGGPHTRYFARQILTRGADAVVVGDGERAIVDFARGKLPQEIPNLWYMGDGPQFSGSNLRVNLADIPIPDLGRVAVHMEEYFQVHQRLHPQAKHRFPASIHTQRGCCWRSKTGGCKFCSITYPGWMGRKAEQIWQEVGRLVRTYGIDFLWDPSDCFTCNREWVKKLVIAKPQGDVAPPWSIYARVDEIDQEVAGYLEQINIQRVYLGVESGSQELLDAMNKGTTLEQNRNAVNLLTEHGITPHLSFIVGYPGENLTTLEASYRHASELAKMGRGIIAVHTFTPWPGTVFFEQLARVQPEFKDTDLIDPKSLQVKWVERFCNVDKKILAEYVVKIKTLFAEVEDFTVCLD